MSFETKHKNLVVLLTKLVCQGSMNRFRRNLCRPKTPKCSQ